MTQRILRMGWLIMVVLAGCRVHEPAKPGAPVSLPAWEHLPEREQLRLGEAVARLQPKTSATLFSPQAGLLRLRVAQDKRELPAGEAWAEFDVTDQREELRRIMKSRQRLDRVIEHGRVIEVPRERIKLQKALDELERQAAINRLVRNQHSRWGAVGIVPMDSPSDTGSGSRLAEETKQMKMVLELLDKDPEAAMGWSYETVRLELEEREIACRRKLDQAVLRMPFAGRLELGVSLLSMEGYLPVQEGQELAVAVQDERMELIVTPTPGEWLALPRDKVYATVTLPNGESSTGFFAGTRYQRAFNHVELQSVFVLGASESARFRLLAGTEAVCNVWLSLPAGVRVVSKLALALGAADACRRKGWAGAAADQWPAARLFAEGDAEIALIAGVPEGAP